MLPARYRPLGLLFFMLALLVCYSRIYLAAHFFGDTYAGSLIGGFLTLLIFNVLNHYKSTLFNKGTIIEHA
jgi:undecaprenyl-diphosphatase